MNTRKHTPIHKKAAAGLVPDGDSNLLPMKLDPPFSRACGALSFTTYRKNRCSSDNQPSHRVQKIYDFCGFFLSFSTSGSEAWGTGAGSASSNRFSHK